MWLVKHYQLERDCLYLKPYHRHKAILVFLLYHFNGIISTKLNYHSVYMEMSRAKKSIRYLFSDDHTYCSHRIQVPWRLDIQLRERFIKKEKTRKTKRIQLWEGGRLSKITFFSFFFSGNFWTLQGGWETHWGGRHIELNENR